MDIIVTESGDLNVLEINTIPGMTEASLLPEAATFRAGMERALDLLKG